MTDQPMPADWAIQRARQEADGDHFYLAFARYIEKHEKPPVDPDVLDVRRILGAWAEFDGFRKALLAGEYDNSGGTQRALAEYKKIKGKRG